MESSWKSKLLNNKSNEEFKTNLSESNLCDFEGLNLLFLNY